MHAILSAHAYDDDRTLSLWCVCLSECKSSLACINVTIRYNLCSLSHTHGDAHARTHARVCAESHNCDRDAVLWPSRRGRRRRPGRPEAHVGWETRWRRRRRRRRCRTHNKHSRSFFYGRLLSSSSKLFISVIHKCVRVGFLARVRARDTRTLTRTDKIREMHQEGEREESELQNYTLSSSPLLLLSLLLEGLWCQMRRGGGKYSRCQSSIRCACVCVEGGNLWNPILRIFWLRCQNAAIWHRLMMICVPRRRLRFLLDRKQAKQTSFSTRRQMGLLRPMFFSCEWVNCSSTSCLSDMTGVRENKMKQSRQRGDLLERAQVERSGRHEG